MDDDKSACAKLNYAMNLRRQIRFGSTTFSFKIIEFRGRLGEDFIGIIRSQKDFLSSALSQMGLPTLVRVLVCDEMPNFAPTLGTFVGENQYYSIRINLDHLHEVELASQSEVEFASKATFVFLHECAHFTHSDEEATDTFLANILKKTSMKKKKGSGTRI